MARWGFVLMVCTAICLILLKTDWFHWIGATESMTEGKGIESGYNHLALEKSPYLIQHADNPVDWYPWNEEAFSKAIDEDKPVFLSIGYSACHWCQVMEEESFRDEEVAEFLNGHFVAVKVDREERPDIDNIYMTVCQALTGSGGWPLTIIMTPDKKPFFAGTYFPKHSRSGHPGLIDILHQVSDLWNRDRDALTGTGNKVTEAIMQSSNTSQAGSLGLETLENAYQGFLKGFDEAHGGFGKAPKFPSPHNISFLLRWWERTGEPKALEMALKTLDAMWQGGMYDHLGFGFHRYSTDQRWLVPHFEKMLYDQAMLSIAYIEAFQSTGDQRFKRVAEEVIDYVFRILTSPEGGFYSSENADSEGEEGKFYAWTLQEVKSILGEERGELFCRFYGVDEAGNLHDGKNVLHRTWKISDFAKNLGIMPVELEEELDRSREELLSFRESRVRPSMDDKILTDWNGLMIVALAKASKAFGEPEYSRAADKAARFILATLKRTDGRLLHRFREGEAGIPGFLDDYAFFVWGLIELYETTFETFYLREALSLTEDMFKLFWDEENGGFYFTAIDGEELITRTKEAYDGAVPSGNSVAALNLLRLNRMTMRSDLQQNASALMQSFGAVINNYPTGFSQFLAALDFELGPSQEIVVAGDLEDEDTERMLNIIRTSFLPRKVVLLHPQRGSEEIEEIAPFVKEQGKLDGEVSVYVCENFACKLPVNDESELISLLRSSK
jgi:uncharacterized protein YyaL (SSP411 family)